MLPELHTSVTEVLVANGRVFQPFIRTFRYSGENISKQSLGTLIGVFEIDDQSEDSAYIVNFLASVAKKEYLSNPRRGAIESFEAALHKINLALAELVKHGNVAWLGKFHGALGVLEKNNLHFSVSGQATILLLRNETIIDLSEDLASDESHIHPLKTFVEVSSGRLNAHDQILFASPELTALFSPEELSKQASRMGHERFTQFLKTALVNELDMAGLMVIDVSESPALVPKKETQKKEGTPEPEVDNVFSQSAFTSRKQQTPTSIHEVLVEKQKEKEEEYIDTKTGHIYVQGETPQVSDAHPFFDMLKQAGEEIPRHFTTLFESLGRYFRKQKKQTALFFLAVGEKGQVYGRKATRAVRRQIRKQQEAQALRKKQKEQEEQNQQEALRAQLAQEERLAALQKPATPAAVPTVSDIPRPTTPSPVPSLPKPQPLTPPQSTEPELPQFLRDKLAQFYKTDKQTALPREKDPTPIEISATASFSQKLAPLLSRGKQVFRTVLDQLLLVVRKGTSLFTRIATRVPAVLPVTQKFFSRPSLIFGVFGLFILIGLGLFFFGNTPTDSTEQATVPTENTDAQSIEAIQNTNANVISDITVLFDGSEKIIASLVLNDENYIVTEQNITSLSDNKAFAFPGNAPARFATAMDDLRLIFIYTENNRLYAFSPISRTFVENSLPFDGTLDIAGIDTYLTYLYVLDSTSDQVYRFPRAEGGFGTSTPWLRESVAVEKTSKFSVNETLFIAPDTTTIRGFFRGRNSSTFEIPGNNLALTDLYTHPGLTNVYGLDATHRRILIWNQDGRLIKEIVHDTFSTGQTLSVNEKEGQFFLGTDTSLLSFKLK